MISGIGSASTASSFISEETKALKSAYKDKAHEFKEIKLDESESESSYSSLPMQKELSEDEKARLEQLKDQLAQMLAGADNPPTSQQRQNIRKVEKEIEKLTGMKMSSSASQTLDKAPKQDDDKEKEKEKQEKMVRSEFLKEQQLRAISLPEDPGASDNGVMAQAMRNRAIAAYNVTADATSMIGKNSSSKSFTV